jgi:hypothetical protein
MQKPSEQERKKKVKFITISAGVLALTVVPIHQRVRKKLRWLFGFFTNLEAAYTVSGMVSSLLEINGS